MRPGSTVSCLNMVGMSHTRLAMTKRYLPRRVSTFVRSPAGIWLSSEVQDATCVLIISPMLLCNGAKKVVNYVTFSSILLTRLFTQYIMSMIPSGREVNSRQPYMSPPGEGAVPLLPPVVYGVAPSGRGGGDAQLPLPGGGGWTAVPPSPSVCVIPTLSVDSAMVTLSLSPSPEATEKVFSSLDLSPHTE